MKDSRDLVDILEYCYTIYGKSTVISRAIPNVYDGLKPVQKRILYILHRQNYRKLVKSTAVCSDTSKYFHPHGEATIYQALTKLAQDFHTRLSVLETQGNGGSADGDKAAATRYTECKANSKLDIYSKDLKYDTVPFISNYSDTDKEPLFLPARLPMILINGSSGIAVGYATNMLPHNPKEVFELTKAYILNDGEVEVQDYISGPDFPTGGIFIKEKNYLQLLKMGQGAIRLRSRYLVKEISNDLVEISFVEMPYKQSKSIIVQKLNDLVNSNELAGVVKVQDLSGREGINLVVTAKKQLLSYVLEELGRKTPLERIENLRNVCLLESKPSCMSFKEIVGNFFEMRKKVVLRCIEDKILENEERIKRNRLSLLLYYDTERILKIVKESSNPQNDLMEFNIDISSFFSDPYGRNFFQPYKLNSQDVQFILSLPISRLRKQVKEGTLEEIRRDREEVESLNEIRSSRELLKKAIVEDMENAMSLIPEDQIQRRTSILEEARGSSEDVEIVLLSYGAGIFTKFFKNEISHQRRGGKGKSYERDGLKPQKIFKIKGRQMAILTDKGFVYFVDQSRIPFHGNNQVMSFLGEFVNLKTGNENVVNVIDLEKEDESHLFLLTSTGQGKLMDLKTLKNQRSKRLISLKEGELLVSARTCSNSDQCLILSNDRALKFNLNSLRISKAGSGGVRVMKADKVITSFTGGKERQFVLVSSQGGGRLDSLDNYKSQTRGGTGTMAAYKNLTLRGLSEDIEDFTVLTTDGRVIRSDLSKLKISKRRTKGVKLVEVDNSEVLTCA